MLDKIKPSASAIRAARTENPNTRDRDFADSLGITEAELVAAYVGSEEDQIVTALTPDPDQIMPQIEGLGEVMALTRNEACVVERVGTYNNYHPGRHAAMILDPDIDLRIFPKFWEHAFAVERPGKDGVKRSIQIFNGVGDAVHKIHLRDGSNHDVWHQVVDALRAEVQQDTLELREKGAPEAPKADPAKAEDLREAWSKMTDTHQFQKVLVKLKMNRLGAYRVVGAPYVRQLAVGSVERAFERISETGMGVMVFVGNRGCIQIHGGECRNIKVMGPWFNVLDPRFDMHLRSDHIHEIYEVRKFAHGGEAVSLEAFDAEGRIILQVFPYRRADENNVVIWDKIVGELSDLRVE